MALDNYFAILKLNTGASHFTITEDRAVRTIKKKMMPGKPSLKSTTRAPSVKFSTTLGHDQPLSSLMRKRSPSFDDLDRASTLDGSFRFTDAASGARWSPPTHRRLRRMNNFNTASRSP